MSVYVDKSHCAGRRATIVWPEGLEEDERKKVIGGSAVIEIGDCLWFGSIYQSGIAVEDWLEVCIYLDDLRVLIQPADRSVQERSASASCHQSFSRYVGGREVTARTA